jgi:hypothetical protein
LSWSYFDVLSGLNPDVDPTVIVFAGGSHDEADAEWIVIRGPMRGRNDTPFGRPTPGRPIVGHPQGVFGVFNYY